MRLVARRFPQTITRRRTAPGRRGDYGQWAPGAVTETEFRASVQPIGLEDVDLEGGSKFSRRLAVYVPEPDALAAAFDQAEADVVIYRTLEYVVEKSQSWPGSHTRAIVLREI